MKKFLFFFFILAVLLAIVLRVRYGGGDAYPDLSSAPLLSDSSLEVAAAYSEPIGDVAVSAGGRIFFTVHPESEPPGNRLLEFVNGAAVPFPDGRSQLQLFDAVLGIAIDSQDRLWTIDNGNHGLRVARLLAFDLDSAELIHDERFDESVAPLGSYLQDLQISADGRTVLIADSSIWRKRPAIIVYDISSGMARRILEGHPSVATEDYRIRIRDHAISFFGGLISLQAGVTGIALGPEWLYFGAMNSSGLYRIRVADLQNRSLASRELAARLEQFAGKPLSDALSIDLRGNVYVTDIEHGAIFRVSADGEPLTLLRSDRLRWPDGLSFGPDGWLYVADSALPDVVLQTREHIRAGGPYYVFRFRPGTGGVAGQ